MNRDRNWAVIVPVSCDADEHVRSARSDSHAGRSRRRTGGPGRCCDCGRCIAPPPICAAASPVLLTGDAPLIAAGGRDRGPARSGRARRRWRPSRRCCCWRRCAPPPCCTGRSSPAQPVVALRISARAAGARAVARPGGSHARAVAAGSSRAGRGAANWPQPALTLAKLGRLLPAVLAAPLRPDGDGRGRARWACSACRRPMSLAYPAAAAAGLRQIAAARVPLEDAPDCTRGRVPHRGIRRSSTSPSWSAIRRPPTRRWCASIPSASPATCWAACAATAARSCAARSPEWPRKAPACCSTWRRRAATSAWSTSCEPTRCRTAGWTRWTPTGRSAGGRTSATS